MDRPLVELEPGARFAGKFIPLRRGEARILDKLVRAWPEAVAFEMLGCSRLSVEVQISNMRRKLPRELVIKNEFGIGYRLIVAQ